MADKYTTNDIGVHALERGVRVVRNGSVSINGERYSGLCLIGRDGQRVELSVFDCYALEYAASFDDGSSGTVKWTRPQSAACA